MRRSSSLILTIFLVFLLPPRGHCQKKGQGLVDSLNLLLTTSQHGPSRDRAATLISLGKAYLAESNFVGATRVLEEGLSLGDKLKDNDLRFEAFRTLGVVYFHQSDLVKAHEYDSIALAFAKSNHNRRQQAAMLKAIGDNYLQLGDSVKSASFYDAALPLFKELGDSASAAAVYSNQSILCNSNYYNKIRLGLMAKRIWDLDDPGNILPVVNLGNIGVAYLDIVRYHRLAAIKPSALIPADRKQLLQLAERYLKEAIQLAATNKDAENAAYYTGVLAELDEQKGDYKNAYHNFREYQNVTDSLFSQENKNKIAALESQGAIDRKNREIENKELQIANQHKKMGLLAGCILFLLVVGGLLIWVNRELAKANRVKAKFFGILSHDLRSPLSSLINLIQYHQRKPDALTPQDIAARENRITDAAKSLLDKMDTVLLWSKGQMEQFKPMIRSVPVSELFSYLQRYFSDTPQILFLFEGGDGLTLMTDEHYLQTILHNLSANAVKALRHIPSPTITWKAWQQQQQTFLSITDNGGGIQDKQLTALYNESAVSGSREGLGFHIIRDLAKAIGCSVTLQPHNGDETVFILSFTS